MSYVCRRSLLKQMIQSQSSAQRVVEPREHRFTSEAQLPRQPPPIPHPVQREPSSVERIAAALAEAGQLVEVRLLRRCRPHDLIVNRQRNAA